MITAFSPEVIEKINHYVYRLIDPRNGNTFYVGQGKGNRVFDHVKGTIKYYDKEELISDSDPCKLRVIQQIKNEGLEVIHVIHRWNLTESEAKVVESALIDAYQGLSNIQKGHHSDFGVTSAETLERTYSSKVYEEPDDFKYLIIKIQECRLNEPNADRYTITRWCWRIRPRSVKEYPYVFSVTNGIVKEVYKISRWIEADENGRFAFEGTVADDTIRNRFLNKRIPEKYCAKGNQSPVLYSKND